MNKVGWIALLVILLAVPQACPVSVKDIVLDDVEYEHVFDVEVEFKGDVQNTIGKFYVDGYEFYPKQNLGAMSEDDDPTVKAEWDNADWENFHGSCGRYTLWVELWTATESELLDNETIEIDLGNMPLVEFIPARPKEDEEFKTRLTDMETGRVATSVDVEIYNYREGESINRKTDTSGMFSYVPQETGKYRMTFTDKDYCGRFEFYVKDDMIVDGPHPENPVVGENVHMAVKPGVGVIIMDEDGDIVQKPPSTIDGGVNFTINEGGKYTIVIGNSSTRYWSMNKTVEISDRPTPGVGVSSPQPVVGEMLTLNVRAAGQPVDNALVSITRPDGVSKDYVTDSSGKIIFDSTINTGSYTVNVNKDRYEETTDSFEVYHRFNAVTTPADATVSDDVTITVTQEAGHAVENALVEIPGAGFRGYTDENGILTVRLPDPKEYAISLSKNGYWDGQVTVRPLGLLSIVLEKTSVEVETPVKISVVDLSGNRVNADINVVNPSGIATPLSGPEASFSPSMAGEHTVRVEKLNYGTREAKLTVTPHPVEVFAEISQGRLRIRTTSHGNPLAGMDAVAVMGEFRGAAATNEQGITGFEIPGTGELNITVSDAAGMFETETKMYEVYKDRNLLLLIVPMLLIAGCTGIVIVGIQYGKFYTKKRRGRKKNQGGGGMLPKKHAGPSKIAGGTPKQDAPPRKSRLGRL